MIVSVIYGGTPEERLPSEKNASDIAHALKTRGHEVHLFRIEKDIISSIINVHTDVVYLCVQGKGYGDGTESGSKKATIPTRISDILLLQRPLRRAAALASSL